MSQDTNITFERNGFSYEFDIADADVADKFETAVAHMGETEKELPKDGKASDIYRAQVRMIKDFFDEILGTDAGKNICGEKDNVRNCYDAYYDFLDFVKAQSFGIQNAHNRYVGSTKPKVSPQKAPAPPQHKPSSGGNRKKHKGKK